ncbi:ATP-binding protein [Actinomadura scrupuli]|uniref:ATP-binding protein n=1 Tax=Actinomadura scrupuli TaxID=559629 RepID=UPI003D993A9B
MRAEPGSPGRRRFRTAVARGVAELGGDRAAEQASGVKKAIWYDAKTGRAIPGEPNWALMRTVLASLTGPHVGAVDWDDLYRVACAEAGRTTRPATASRRRSDPDLPRRPIPRQLPPGTKGFTGRATALASLDRCLDAQDALPIMVVTGPPGVGKTTLAVHWSRRREPDFPDGVLFADLRGWGPDRPGSAEEVLAGWLRALGVAPTEIPDGTDGRSAALRTALAGRRLLLVLDNAGSEDQVRPFLPGIATCPLLVTGRRKLPGLSIHHGAEGIPLGMLTKPESVQLLRGIVGDRVDQAPDVATGLAAICGHLPLALRILAEIVRSRPDEPLTAFLSELANKEDRLDLLSMDDPRSDPRVVFSWSYEQLSDEVAMVFRLLGLFPGTAFGPDAVAALTGASRRAASAGLKELARRQLLQGPEHERYQMHDLLRLYAAELARDAEGPDGVAAALLRLMHHYLDTARRADELVVPQRYRLPGAVTAEIVTDLDGYDQALDWLNHECATMVELCRVDGPGLDPLRWRLAFALRGYFFLTKRLDPWIDSHEAALTATVRIGDTAGEAMTRSNLGVAFHENGDDDRAMEQYRIAERLFREVNDPHGVSNTLAHQAAVLRHRGELPESLEHSRQALDFYRGAGSRRNVAITLRGIALVEIELGRYPEAESHLAESLAICAELDMHMDAARAHNSRGRVLGLLGRHEDSGRAYLEAIRDSERCDSDWEKALAMQGLGSTARDQGDMAQAAAHWTEALSLFRLLGSPRAQDVETALAELGDQSPP